MNKWFKMSRKVFFIFILLVSPIIGFAQLMYPIVGDYKNKGAQAMAIYDDYAYLFNDSGLCRILNLKNGRIEGEFMLQCAAKDTHVNSACFSRRFAKGYSIPALYITEFYGKRRCFVELINDKCSKLVQTIEYKDSHGAYPFVREWMVDNEEQMLYALIRRPDREEINEIIKFSLPLLGNGVHIVLSDKDVLDKFTVRFVNGPQGGVIRGRYMYVATGFTPLHGEGKYFDREIMVIDLKRKKLIRSIDISKVTMNEPEGLDFYKGNCLLFAGGTGGIYKAF